MQGFLLRKELFTELNKSLKENVLCQAPDRWNSLVFYFARLPKNRGKLNNTMLIAQLQLLTHFSYSKAIMATRKM